jgi:hydrogenase small subunit
MPKACKIGEHYFTDQVIEASKHANAVIAVGTCAAFGGIPAAENNPTGAQSVGDFLKDNKVRVPLINIPGCPVHPDWVTGTLVHALKFGLPELDGLNRPKAFFSRLIHDQCPRFADYERENFAKHFTDPGCLFKLGCQGPITHADCTVRLWNAGTSSCIHADAPCIGCASEFFSKKKDYPFYPRNLITE